MNPIEKLSQDARITIRKSGAPDPAGKCVVYWMQRAQRAIDNPALDVAIRAGNELDKPVVVFLAPVPFYPRANLRHYCFLADGIPDIAQGLTARGVGFVLLHLFMVVASGTWNNIRSMITGRYAIVPDKTTGDPA